MREARRSVVVAAVLLLAACDARQGRVLLWHLDDVSAPGETVVFEVGLWRVLRGAIERVEVESPALGIARRDVVPARGCPDYGMYLQTRRGDSLPAERIEIPIPGGAPRGEAALRLFVHYCGAESAGPSTFSSIDGSEELEAKVTVVAPGGELVHRAAFLGLRLALLLAFALVAGVASPVDDHLRGLRTAITALAYLGWIGASHFVLGAPVARAFAITPWWQRGLVTLATIVTMVIVASIVVGARERKAR